MIVALAFAILLQAPTPAAPPAPRESGTVRGRITSAETGRPLKRANIRLQSAEGAAVRISSSTNAQGVFEVRGVPPGPYLIFASRGGYLPLQYGQRYQSQRGTTIEVSAGAAVEKIDVALPRAGVIGGRVTDELGEPYPNVQVVLLAPRVVGGKRAMVSVGTAQTDDIGQFRIGGLWPGAYHLMAVSTETWLNDRKETLGYASTYYPGVTAGAAQTVTLAASQQRLDVDVPMVPGRAVTVSGRVQTEVPGMPPVTEIWLAYAIGEGFTLSSGARKARVESDGSFEVKDVTSGVYSIRAGGALDQLLTVGETDVTGLTLVSRVGSTVTGRLVTEDDAPPPFSPSGVRVTLVAPYDNVLPTVRVASPDADWWIKMPSLGGPFLFRVSGLPPGWALGAVKLGDRDISDVPWDVPTGARQLGGLKIVLTQKVGRVAGAVTTSDGKPAESATVIVFAEDEKLWVPGSRCVRIARPDKDGLFSLSGVPAGTYLAVARELVEEGEWEDPAFLEQLRAGGTRFTLAEGGSQPLTLRLPSPKSPPR